MSSPAPLIDAPKSRGKLYAIVAIAVLAIVAIVVAIVAVSGNTNDANRAGANPGEAGDAIATGPGSAGDPVRIGVVGASEPQWAPYVAAAAAAGISVELVDFSEYNQPNPALSADDLDLNQFQHLVYLAEYNVASNEDLVPLGATAIYPLGLYSSAYGSVDEIEDGDTVAVPNDPSNLARSLLVLQSAGLIELTGGGSALSGLDDIDAGGSRVEVIALEAALTVTSLPDVAAAIINNDFITDAGLTPDDALFQDDPSDPSAVPYVNVFAARSADADNAVYLKLVDIFQNTDAVTDALVEGSGGTAILAATPVDELVDTLTTVEEDTAAAEG